MSGRDHREDIPLRYGKKSFGEEAVSLKKRTLE
jgi:hypothetical protein